MSAIAVDFDGVVHSYHRGWSDGSIYGEFKPGAMAGLMTLLDNHPVFIHTSRRRGRVARWIERQSGHAIECVTWIAPWRRFWDTRGILLVTNRKLPAVAYLDDRAVRFTDWPHALVELTGPRCAEHSGPCFPDPDPSARCPAHGDRACPSCHRNPGDCASGHGSCGYWPSTGMHWDTCANRRRG